MSKLQSSPPASTGTGLYLVITPDVMRETAQWQADVVKLVSELPVAAVLIRTGGPPQADLTELKTLVSQLHDHELAAMIESEAELARMLNADGVHLAWQPGIVEAYDQARETLGERALIGADAGKSRHDAMVLGERGADYISFGVPPHVKDRDAASRRRAELVAWWAEVFEVPVVATDIASETEIESLKVAGADFIAVTLPPQSADQPNRARWIETVSTYFTA